jgi:hypothetical protein
MHIAVQSPPLPQALADMPFPDRQLPPSLHPLDATDRPLVEALLATRVPSDGEIVDAARLHTRYCDSRLSPDLAVKIRQAIKAWGYSLSDLQEAARRIWQSGWRPASPASPEEQQVGSGADVEG